VLPGAYTVSVELAGFKRFVQQNVLVQARGDVTVDALLEVRTATESVTVEASPAETSYQQRILFDQPDPVDGGINGIGQIPIWTYVNASSSNSLQLNRRMGRLQWNANYTWSKTTIYTFS
jgi:hypothetical protein